MRTIVRRAAALVVAPQAVPSRTPVVVRPLPKIAPNTS
jgi:hypothetical protein